MSGRDGSDCDWIAAALTAARPQAMAALLRQFRDLDAAEEAIVVRRLMGAEMFSGYGIRTMSTANGAYWPTRYHVGSVWTHDSAMIIEGMLRAGFTDEASTLAHGLLRAAEGFDYRLPELFGGQSADEVFPPVPYPASCRPQAWAAASGIAVARALGGL